VSLIILTESVDVLVRSHEEQAPTFEFKAAKALLFVCLHNAEDAVIVKLDVLHKVALVVVGEQIHSSVHFLRANHEVLKSAFSEQLQVPANVGHLCKLFDCHGHLV
jgi:hypothetical protein